MTANLPDDYTSKMKSLWEKLDRSSEVNLSTQDLRDLVFLWEESALKIYLSANMLGFSLIADSLKSARYVLDALMARIESLSEGGENNEEAEEKQAEE